eukprot:TRINITY_DN5334_c0_g1_i1.p1 TRINITY_DN5334_c0_g1~~TRINITY_DN5334_c0_g1_i1.p1  ORF type:complete len:391 (-),score=45.88 TRINITY_DN5334_c0_g1_i1:114-1286(-)
MRRSGLAISDLLNSSEGVQKLEPPGGLFVANSQVLSNSFQRYVHHLNIQSSTHELTPNPSIDLELEYDPVYVKSEPVVVKKRPHTAITIAEIIPTDPVVPLPQVAPFSGGFPVHLYPNIVQSTYRPPIKPGVRPKNREAPSSPMVARIQRSDQRDETVASPASGSEYDEMSAFRCKWNNCTEGFSTRTGLATHVSTHLISDPEILTRQAEDKTPIFCHWNTCTEQYATLKKLTKHLARVDHVGQTPFLSKSQEQEASKRRKKFACSFPGCNKSFTDSSNRKKHEHTHDTNRERFHCTEPRCTKSYTKRADLKVHLKIHRGEYPHKCTHPNCGKAFVRISELYTHERIHDNMRLHVCDQCGKSFSETSRLKKHLAIHESGEICLRSPIKDN